LLLICIYNQSKSWYHSVDGIFPSQIEEFEVGIKFDDDSVINADDWQQIKRYLANQSRSEGDTRRVTEIRSRDGVTIKTGNLEMKKKSKMPLANPNAVSGEYRGWTIRVWRDDKGRYYGCNVFIGEDVRYFDLTFDDVDDENGVFRYAKAYIDNLISEQQ
jgi:hypothetical protein